MKINKQKIILFGASGMVGAAVLSECLNDPSVREVLSVGRRECGMNHPKLKELLVPDLFDLEAFSNKLKGFDACFFTVGVSAAGLSEAEYAKYNHDLPVKIAKLLLKLNKNLSFCYVSGGGTDSTEKGPVMWARVKGRTENELMKMRFKSAVMFRLGALQPLKGFKSRTRLYRVMYDVLGPILPMMGKLFPGWVLTPRSLGQAMIRAGKGESPKSILEPKDIYELGKDGEGK